MTSTVGLSLEFIEMGPFKAPIIITAGYMSSDLKLASPIGVNMIKPSSLFGDTGSY